MRDKQDRGRILVRIAVTFNGEVAAVADHVRIGHDAVAFDDKARADAPLNAAGIPGAL